MGTRSLRETLGLVTALAAAACGGKIAGDGGGTNGGSSSSGAPTGTAAPPEEDVCPYTVEVRGFDVTVTSDVACTLAADAPPCFGAYCEPAGKDCASPCSDPAVNACSLPQAYLASFKLAQGDAGTTCPPADTMTLHCAVTERHGTKTNGCPVEGRRPAGLAAFVAFDGETALGAYFAECEWLEAASVVAFGEIGDALAGAGAPRSLIDACRSATDDEIRHTNAMGALRARFGGRARSVEARPTTARTILHLALENAAEGLVRETYGAAVALWRAAHATDPEVRRALAAIAEDECRHAELARRLAAFFGERLRPDERVEVARVERETWRALARELEVDPAAILTQVAGVPRAHEASAILRHLARELAEAA